MTDSPAQGPAGQGSTGSGPEQDDLEPQTMSVKVLNKNEFQIKDMFDGVPYVFVPHVPVNVPVDAAFHIFGWHPPYTDAAGARRQVDPEAMRRHIMKRFGWNTPQMAEHGRSEHFYSLLEISPIRYRMVPVEVDDEGNPIRRRKTLHDHPPEAQAGS